MDIKTIMQKLDRLSDQVAVLGKIQQVLLKEVLDLSPNRQEMMLNIMSGTLAVDSLRNEFTEYAMEQDNDDLKILSTAMLIFSRSSSLILCMIRNASFQSKVDSSRPLRRLALY